MCVGALREGSPYTRHVCYYGKMERQHPFIVGEFYHIYNRGVEKKNIYRTDGDRRHFQRLLYTRNSTGRIDSDRVKGLPLRTIKRGSCLTEVIAYCMMPNHFHLLLRESVEGGISAFMGKLGTAYSMFVNTKYERSGPLMCRPFRSKHVSNNDYFQWVFAYIHLNPRELVSQSSRSDARSTSADLDRFLRNYPYSSFPDYVVGKRDESAILSKSNDISALLKDARTVTEMIKLYKDMEAPHIFFN